MRLLTVAALLAAAFASSSAFAQHVHHKYCLRLEEAWNVLTTR